MAENYSSHSSAVSGLVRLGPIRSTMSKQQFLVRLAQSIDDQGTLWRLKPNNAIPQASNSSLSERYVGHIENNVFYLRRPLFEGAERAGVTVRGKVVDTNSGSLISVSCEPSPAVNLLVGFCLLLFVLSFVFALVYALSVRNLGQGFELLLHCLTFAAPLLIGALFLKAYIHYRMFPDRELFNHVASIAQAGDPQH